MRTSPLLQSSASNDHVEHDGAVWDRSVAPMMERGRADHSGPIAVAVARPEPPPMRSEASGVFAPEASEPAEPAWVLPQADIGARPFCHAPGRGWLKGWTGAAEMIERIEHTANEDVYMRPARSKDWHATRDDLKGAFEALDNATDFFSTGQIFMIIGVGVFVFGAFLALLPTPDPLWKFLCPLGGLTLGWGITSLIALRNAWGPFWRIQKINQMYQSAAPATAQSLSQLLSDHPDARPAWEALLAHVDASGVPLLVGDVEALRAAAAARTTARAAALDEQAEDAPSGPTPDERLSAPWRSV